MSVRYSLRCEACEKVSQEVGNDGFTGPLGFCSECREISNAFRSETRPLDNPVCSSCGSETRLLPLKSGAKELAQFEKVSILDCPWCEANASLKPAGASLAQPVFSSPETGDTVHCRIIGVCEEGLVGTTNGLSYLIISGGPPEALHTWSEVVKSEERARAVFKRILRDSGDELLDELEIHYEDEPCLLLNAGEIARMTAQNPLKYWDLWQFSVGIHTSRRPPEKSLRLKTRGWTLDLSTLFRLEEAVSRLAQLWHPDQFRWLSFDQVRGTVEFSDGSRVEWGAPWENSAEIDERTSNERWGFTLHTLGGQTLWSFPMRPY